MELVDTKDLKSFGHCGRAGSSPAPGTKNASKINDFRGIFFPNFASSSFSAPVIIQPFQHKFLKIAADWDFMVANTDGQWGNRGYFPNGNYE